MAEALTAGVCIGAKPGNVMRPPVGPGARRARYAMAAVLFLVCGLHAGCRCRGPQGARDFPGKRWRTVDAAHAGFDVDRLQAFADHVGGAGCVVRGGRMAFSWGYHDQPVDVASAAKTVHAHLVYAAVAEGRIPSLDAAVSESEPGLRALNAALGHKDAGFTWRQLIEQTACYGVSEEPGAAFNYSDYQSALLIDTLVFRVYRTGYFKVDGDIFGPALAQRLQCEDSPTMDSERSHPGRLRISARDFARFGLLYLAEGRWRGHRVLPREFVANAWSRPHPSTLARTEQVEAEMLPDQRSLGSGPNQERHMNSFSSAWWVNGIDDDGQRVLPDVPADAFLAQGHAGHDTLAIIPSLDLVVCWVDAFPGKAALRYCYDGHRRVNEALRRLLAARLGDRVDTVGVE